MRLLPALPDAWPEGAIEGVLCRGQVEVQQARVARARAPGHARLGPRAAARAASPVRDQERERPQRQGDATGRRRQGPPHPLFVRRPAGDARSRARMRSAMKKSAALAASSLVLGLLAAPLGAGPRRATRRCSRSSASSRRRSSGRRPSAPRAGSRRAPPTRRSSRRRGRHRHRCRRRDCNRRRRRRTCRAGAGPLRHRVGSPRGPGSCRPPGPAGGRGAARDRRLLLVARRPAAAACSPTRAASGARNTRGDYWVLDLAQRRAAPARRRRPAVDADVRQVLAGRPPRRPTSARTTSTSRTWPTGAITRLTSDGSDTLINGTFDWVYEEELGLRDGFRWSPDGAADRLLAARRHRGRGVPR